MLIKTHRLRVLIVATLSLLTFGIIEYRLYQVQIVQHDLHVTLAQKQQNKTVTLFPRRGDILDRNDQVLATSTFYDTVSFNPARIDGELPDELARRLAAILERPRSSVEKILRRNKRTRLRRKLPPEAVQALHLLEEELDLPENLLEYRKESKRLYPHKDLAATIIGFTGVADDDTGDNKGLEGIEREYNDILRGDTTKQRISANSWKQGLQPLREDLVESIFGDTLVLTIDSQIQHYAQKALRKGVGAVQAESGVAVVMDVATGEILAMASCPDFDPNEFGRASAVQWRNRAVTDPVEIGSVMKIMTAAILLDNGLLDLDEMIDCENGAAMIDGKMIRDTHRSGVVTYRESFIESSNVAHAKLGIRLEPELYYEHLRKFGLGQRPESGLPGENKGTLHPVTRWTALSRSRIPIGYETSLTALHVASAVAAIGNGGVRMKPRIVKRIVAPTGHVRERFEPEEVARVVSPDTCELVIELMRDVVEKGTGTEAMLPGYDVGGKTGTTRKIMPGKHYVASFAGLIPLNDPKLAIYVFINEPDPDLGRYGGAVSGPVFREIAEHAMQILDIPPTEPERFKEYRERLEQGIAHRLAAESIARAAEPRPRADKNASIRETIRKIAEEEGSPLIAAANAEDDASAVARSATQGRVPSVLGLTMPAALKRFADAGLRVRLFGSGIAISQKPLPGTTIAAGDFGEVVFAGAKNAGPGPSNGRIGSGTNAALPPDL